MRFCAFILVLVAVLTGAGCAEQDMIGKAASNSAANGIDNLAYGQPAPPAYGAHATPPHRPAAGPLYASMAPPSPPPRATAARGLPPTLFASNASTDEPVVVAAPAAPIAALAYAPPVESGPYTLDSGDRLRIVVFGQDGLSNSYVVGASGNIDMPLIGPVAARAATTDGLAKRIAERLRQGFIREPHVAVEVEAYRPFFILGEVTQPGQYPYVANMTIETAVAIAGGFSPRAFRQTVILNRVVDGQQVRAQVPVTYPLRPGDTVNVQERWF
jgi:polysaccharide export outer membrane protein